MFDFVSTSLAEGSRLLERQRLPLSSVVIVERIFEDNRFGVSDADSEIQLNSWQRDLQDLMIYRQDSLKKSELDEIKTGDFYIFQTSDQKFYRVCVLDKKDEYVSFRLVDFGVCMTSFYTSLICLEEDIEEYDRFREQAPFMKRVNLPPDAVLRELGLPTSAMIRPGDVVELITFTPSEPYFGVFGFTRSSTYRFLPKNFTDGFNEEQTKNWLSLFDIGTMAESEPRLLMHGYGELADRSMHDNRMALIAYPKALNKVYVHDSESAIRLSMMRDRMEIIYGDEKSRSKFAIQSLSEVSAGVGCVAFNKALGAYVRVRVISMSPRQAEVAPIDTPTLGIFFVGKDEIFRVPISLAFPRQCFTVRMCRNVEGHVRCCLSQLARCVIPAGTLVVLDSDEDGLTRVYCSNAPGGVLAKLQQSKTDAHSTTIDYGFSADRHVVPERIDDLSKFNRKSKAPAKSAMKQSKRPSATESKQSEAKEDTPSEWKSVGYEASS